MLCSLWCHRVVDIGAHFPSSLPSIKDNKSLVLSWIMQQDWMNIFPTGFPSAPAAHTPTNICILWWFSWTMSFSLRNLLQHNSPQDLTGSSERMFGHYCFICLTSLFYIIVQERAWTGLHWATSCRALQTQSRTLASGVSWRQRQVVPLLIHWLVEPICLIFRKNLKKASLETCQK